jgi:hypothetical protein
VKNPLTMKSWSPYVVGTGVGVLSWFAFAFAEQPLGISTAFEHSAALIEKAVVPQVEQTNEYFARQTEAGKSPKIGLGWMLVLGVFVGALLSSSLSGDRSSEVVPAIWRARFGGNVPLRLAAAFFAGALMLFGARLADGCTSGHGISGSLQLAVSSWVFTIVLFATGTVTALALYGRKERSHV